MSTRSVNVTIDNINPLIVYEPWSEWREGSTSDPSYSSYDNNGTFTLTSAAGSTATFKFYGTSVWVMGAKRSNHGTYSATIDGRTYDGLSGKLSPEKFIQPLFSAVNLENTFHTVVMNNTGTTQGQNYFDIDSITYETQVDIKATNVTQEDDDPAFDYSGGRWSNNPENLGGYSGGTGHTTSDRGAFVTYTFKGSSVQIFGTAGPQNGEYTVQVDDQDEITYNATKQAFYPQVLLYETGGLGDGTHTVTLKNEPLVDGQQLNIDFATVTQSPSQSSSSKSSGLSGGAIGGIVAGIVILALLGAVALFFYLRRRRTSDIQDAESGSDQHPPGGLLEPYSYRQTNPNQVSQTKRHRMETSATRDLPSVNEQSLGSTAGIHNRNLSGASSTLMTQTNSSPIPVSDVPTPMSSSTHLQVMNGTSGTSSRSLPLTPHQQARSASQSELSEMRMRVEGLPQDFGPISPGAVGPPPNYIQATEPFPPRPTSRYP